VYVLLYTVYCVLCTVYCVLCTVYCVLCTVYCVLSVCMLRVTLDQRDFGGDVAWRAHNDGLCSQVFGTLSKRWGGEFLCTHSLLSSQRCYFKLFLETIDCQIVFMAFFFFFFAKSNN
jgi:hypothetical protein